MSRGLPPVNRCIYCGASDVLLSREHVVPFGLGGNIVLPKASCAKCAAATASLEGYCLGMMLGVYRGRTKYPSRQKKFRKSNVSVAVTYADGSEGDMVIPVGDFPELLMLPVFPSARILAGLAPEKLDEKVDIGAWGWSNKQEIEDFQARHGLVGFHVGQVNPMKFSRLIAKIAYAGACAQLGADAFDPVGIESILGDRPTMNYYVGSGNLASLAGNDNANHWYAATIQEPSGMVVGIVRLFAHLGAPTYHVVVGTRPGGAIQSIMEQQPPPREETEFEFPFNISVGPSEA